MQFMLMCLLCSLIIIIIIVNLIPLFSVDSYQLLFLYNVQYTQSDQSFRCWHGVHELTFKRSVKTLTGRMVVS